MYAIRSYYEIDATAVLVKQIERAMAEQRVGSDQTLQALSSINDIGQEVKEMATSVNRGADDALKAMEELSRTSATVLGSMRTALPSTVLAHEE